MINHPSLQALLLAALLLNALSLQAAHVTDKLLAGLYSEPDLASTPVKVLPSGTPMEVLEKKGDFSKVRLGDNTEGWIENQFITNEKPARIMLLELQAKYSKSQRELQKLKRQLKPGNNSNDSTGVESSALQGQLTAANRKIAELEKALKEKDKSKDTTAQLQARIDELESALKSAQQQPSVETDSALAEELETLKERMQKAATLLGANTTPEPSVTTTNDGYNLWWIILASLALLLGFIGGVAFKNYRLAKRYGGFRI